MKMFKWTAAAVLFCALFALPARAQTVREARPRQERNRIRAEEIEQSHASNVYQLIQARRGMWLMRNNPTDMSGTGSGLMLVFLDGAQLDGLEELRQIPAAGVHMVEFLSPAETEHRLGKYTSVGAIRILTRDETPADSGRSGNHG